MARDEREAAAGKLEGKVPDLIDLSLVIRETRPEGCVSDTHYTRRVVIHQAPALFEIPCSDPHCQDGGYDVTREILAALASHRVDFEGERSCDGRRGAIDCGRSLRYVAKATYAVARREPQPGLAP